MRVSGSWLQVLAVCAAIMLAAGAPGAVAQTGLSGTPPGVVGDSGAAAAPSPDPVVAEVEGHAIHLSEVGDEIRALPGGGGNNSFDALYPAALRRLIERAAIVIHAQHDGLAEDPAVRRHMQEVANQVLEDAYLQHATAARITEQMLLARYDAEISGKPGPVEVHGRAILVPTEAAAQAIIDKLAAGADFAALARADSTDATAGSGGDLGFVLRQGVNPMLGAVLFSLKPGEVTAYPVQTPAGWFVLQCLARQRAPTPSFAAARERLEEESQRDEVLPVVRAALTGLSVRAYDMNGHTMAPPSEGEAAAPGDDH